MESKGKFIVICIEGCHGSGKTSLVNWFSKMGFTILNEGFMQESELLHPQSFTMEFGWVWNWFDRLMKIRAKYRNKDMVVIADRSPYSAVFYAHDDNGFKMQDAISHMIEEVKKIDIDIYTVMVHVDKETLFRRIASRLAQEPHRAAYNEHKIEWNEHIYKKYQAFNQWDLVLDNNQERKMFVELVHKVIQQVQLKAPNDIDLLKVNQSCREFLSFSPVKQNTESPSKRAEDCESSTTTRLSSE